MDARLTALMTEEAGETPVEIEMMMTTAMMAATKTVMTEATAVRKTATIETTEILAAEVADAEMRTTVTVGETDAIRIGGIEAEKTTATLRTMTHPATIAADGMANMLNVTANMSPRKTPVKSSFR